MAQDTYANLLVRAADNTTGDITPSDLRVIIETLQPTYGSLSLASSAATVIAAADTFVIAGGTTMLDAHARHFEQSANFTFRYTGTVPVAAFVSGSLSITSASPNRLMRARLAKNGDPGDAESVATEAQRYIATSDLGSMSIGGHLSLDADDTVALYIANGTAVSDFTIVRATIQITAFVL
jgi:hypothetical protein